MSGDLALLVEAAQEAGAVALRFWRKSPQVWDKGGDEGPVSEADLAVNDALRARLCGARPGYGWLSEEGPADPARVDAARAFVIDPIDGTRAFLEGHEGFALSLAVAEAGRIVAAVVHLPARGTTYAAAEGQPATRDGRVIRVTDAGAEGARLLTPKANLAPVLWRGGRVPPVARHFRPSVAWRMALVAEGAFDGVLSLRAAWEWDIAAGALIVAQAGGVVTDLHGAALRFNRADPRTEGLMAAGPRLHAALAGGLA